jgi:16S rRNA (adenine1518-N6/adenine1519-N6)-dimethyltransferase
MAQKDSLAAKKSLGQHWLNDKTCLESICEEASLNEQDTVLEIGPGLGSLTRLLLKKAKEVIAVELDEKLVANLIRTLPSANLEIINQDILTYNLNDLPKGYKLVANIPYYLSSNLVRVISESTNPPSVAALLVQKEVAERIAAAPGDMSILSVSTQLYWHVSLGRVVEAKMFVPVPKVDSQIIKLERRVDPLFKNVESNKYLNVVKAGFSQKRKTLSNSLSAGLRLSKKEIEKACLKANVDPKRRPQTLSLEEWHGLYLALT